MTAMVAVGGLRKSFGGKEVLGGVGFEVAEGSTFALLGPNGAGKTTTVRILSTLIRGDGGTAKVAGHDVTREPDAVRRSIGVTGQFSAVDDVLTGRENLDLMADLNRLGRSEKRARVAGLLDRFDLAEAAGSTAATYSGGMRRRLDLAMTLIGRPRVIFLDEPTTGLDPRSRRMMWQLVRDLVADGVTIFLTTQYLEEADRLADRIGVLDGGRLVAEGTPEQLKRSLSGGHVRLVFDREATLRAAADIVDGAVVENDALALTVPGDGGVLALRALLDRLDRSGIEVEVLSVHTPDLDDVFLALTGRRPESRANDTMKGTTQTGIKNEDTGARQ